MIERGAIEIQFTAKLAQSVFPYDWSVEFVEILPSLITTAHHVDFRIVAAGVVPTDIVDNCFSCITQRTILPRKENKPNTML